MAKPTIRIHNIETNEVIDREMNVKEFAEYEATQVAQLARQAEAQAKAQAKAVLLERLGLTQEEFNTLTA
jgi:pantoate kinase